jgi:hypothetical protein
MFTEHEDVPSAGEVGASGIESSGAPDQLEAFEASEFKSWILENTNFMEKTLTEKIALLQQAPVAVENSISKPKIKLMPKPKKL